MITPFELFLFAVARTAVREAGRAGVAGFVVDWERRGKRERQAGADTEINVHTRADLANVRRTTGATILCRIDPEGPSTPDDVEAAIENGADEILLPMVRSVSEVQRTLRIVRGRCGVGILVETVDACSCAPELARLPLSRVYVGLNDLAIERNSRTIFAALIDGTVERVRESFHVPFGVAGLTRPDRGEPIPCRLLIGELARLACDFTFMRRSFHRDVRPDEYRTQIPRLLDAVAVARSRTSEEVRADRRELIAAVETIEELGLAV